MNFKCKIRYILISTLIVIAAMVFAIPAAGQKTRNADDFSHHIPDPKDLMWLRGDDIDQMLRKMGYEGDYKYGGGDFDTKYVEFGDYGYYVLEENDKEKIEKSILISFHYEEDGAYDYTLEVWIEGAPNDLNLFYQKALKLKKKGTTMYTDVTKEGDKITITSGGD